MTITELLKDIVEGAKDRLKNPLSGAFVWAFIIFNWRPLIFLMFSDKSIEHKIIDINYEYCSVWTIIVPLGMALIYTIGLPFFMLLIENLVQKTNEKRIENTYKTRGVKMDGKIELATKEFTLQNKRTGNKAIEELQDENDTLKAQISALQESINQINDSNTQAVENLNAILKKSNESLINSQMQNDRLRETIEDYKKQFPTFHLEKQNSASISKRLNDGSKNLPTRLKKLVSEELLNIEFAELEFLQRVKINDKKQLMIETLTDLPLVQSLLTKSIIKSIPFDNEIMYGFNEVGSIIYDILHDKI